MTQAIALESITQCLKQERKTHDCKELLDSSASREFLLEQSKIAIGIKDNAQSSHNMAKAEISSAEEVLNTKVSVANGALNNAFYVVGKGSKWENRNDLQDLKRAQTDVLRGHEDIEGASMNGPKECCYGSSPAISRACVQDLREKIAALEQYEMLNREAEEAKAAYVYVIIQEFNKYLQREKEVESQGDDILLGKEASAAEMEKDGMHKHNEEL